MEAYLDHKFGRGVQIDIARIAFKAELSLLYRVKEEEAIKDDESPEKLRKNLVFYRELVEKVEDCFEALEAFNVTW